MLRFQTVESWLTLHITFTLLFKSSRNTAKNDMHFQEMINLLPINWKESIVDSNQIQSRISLKQIVQVKRNGGNDVVYATNNFAMNVIQREQKALSSKESSFGLPHTFLISHRLFYILHPNCC